jgi:hypothetical protein
VSTHPWGYGTTMVTVPEMIRRTQQFALPPFIQRVEAWATATGLDVRIVPCGCGGGMRTVQPNRPGFAKPVFVGGEWRQSSFHLRQPFADGNEWYSAWDVVVAVPGRVHRAPTWAEIESAKPFGLHAFISGEPWHIQCVEMRGFTPWWNDGRKVPTMNWSFPGQPPAIVEPPLNSGAYSPPQNWWLFPLDGSKPRLGRGSKDASFIGHVRYLQDVISLYAGGNIARDGDFGPQTEGRVKDLQRTFDLKPDGVVGAQTWGVVDFLVARNAPKPPPAPTPKPPTTAFQSVSPVLYLVRPGDSPWKVGERVYASGKMGADLLGASLFKEHGHHIPIPQVAGRATTVQSGDGAYKLLARMKLERSQLTAFYAYNGGKERTLRPGDRVHVAVTG